jgi:nucleoside-triphosphatase
MRLLCFQCCWLESILEQQQTYWLLEWDLMKRLLLLTGTPGVGKTTVLLKTVEQLKLQGVRVGGMISREVRIGGERVGFEILDLMSGNRGWLAHVEGKEGPRVGKYRVNLEDVDLVGVEAVLDAVESADVVVIDEVGPMELCSERFRVAVTRAVEGERVVVGVVHWKARDMVIDEVKKREDLEMVEVTCENRDDLPRILFDKVVEVLPKA